MAEPYFTLSKRTAIDQRPKNNQSRIITGIGTPSSQSKSPRPIFASLESAVDSTTKRGGLCSVKRAERSSPMPGVRHRSPRLCRRFRIALLQELDRMQIRRADERHLAVARRTIDGDAEFHQALAGRIDVVDLVSEVAEITILAVFFLLPIVGEFDQRRAASLGLFQQALIFGRAQKYQREFCFVVVDAPDLLQSERILIEFQRGIEIADAQHGVEITHVSCSLEQSQGGSAKSARYL